MKRNMRTDQPRSFLREFDRSLKDRISSRIHELNKLRGWRRIVRRVQIECWAWAKTLTTKPRNGRTIE